MANISIRNLDDGARDRLRVRAAQHGRSMEAEARTILEEAVADAREEETFVGALIAAARAVGGVDLDIPPRDQTQRIVDFS